ncbi:hypothetical protein EV421DRAFT_1735585 [Armillaria borealis]|uniref:Uncharacterized protein n=1 Tax=Armillaria borealis TaxID=47425 RepID=A0AA39JKZ5_9AGAR|nr:hypothetical protein EV421DRAFT_1735585 [Armillaria borealis]
MFPKWKWPVHNDAIWSRGTATVVIPSLAITSGGKDRSWNMVVLRMEVLKISQLGNWLAGTSFYSPFTVPLLLFVFGDIVELDMRVNLPLQDKLAFYVGRARPNTTFHQHYYFVAESRPDGCTAWVDAWEPALQEAEDWFGELTSRIESQYMLYPILDEQRAGPAVLEVCRRMGINVGADISDADLLRFLVALATIGDHRPDSTTTRLSMTTSVSLPVPPGDSGLGYMVGRPWADDRDEYRDEESPVDHVLFVTGGWLYDLVGVDGITLLHSREDVSISHRTLFPGKFSAICMPSFRPDFPGWLPQRHNEEEPQIFDAPRDYGDGDQGHTRISLSNFKSDGFPLLSVLDKGSTAPRGAVAAFIQVRVRGRIIETAYRPVVKCGSPCEHRERWGRMTHCALTSYEILERVLPPSDDELSTSANADIFELERSASGQEAYVLRRRMQVISDRLVKLSEAGAPLERNRACIVRCGARDGPIDPVVVLAASLKKKVYVIHRRNAVLTVKSASAGTVQFLGCKSLSALLD